jgi:hypothetical protein
MANPELGNSLYAVLDRIHAVSKPSTREPRGYSALNVIEGSTLAARQAGTQQAIAETATSSAMTAR